MQALQKDSRRGWCGFGGVAEGHPPDAVESKNDLFCK